MGARLMGVLERTLAQMDRIVPALVDGDKELLKLAGYTNDDEDTPGVTP